MKNKKFILIGGLLVALLVVGVIGATHAFAQAAPTALFYGGGPGGGHGFGLGQVELDAAAKALGMTSSELSTALQSGKTLTQIASDKKVDLQTVQNAIKSAHVVEMRTQIKQAVTDGKLTQAKADWLLEGLDKGFLDGPGIGFGGFGLGGPRGGHGFGGGPLMSQPTQPSNP